jgi:hypothetical protein
MRDIEKQIVYQQILHGRRAIEELSGKELKELNQHWFDDHYRAMPPIDFDIKIRNEQRRREVQTASKPLRPIDRNFFGG